MKNISKSVYSNQSGIHPDLLKILNRCRTDSYQRPIASFSVIAFNSIIEKLSCFRTNDFILDIGCGTGESSYNLALKNPEVFVIGIDKSLSRLNRKNEFKINELDNYFLVRAEALDLIYQFAIFLESSNLNLIKTYFIFPNPWPKEKHVKRRFSANPVVPFIFRLNCEIEIRSNWKIYVDEFSVSALYYDYLIKNFNCYVPKEFISSFEKKYHLSSQKLFLATYIPSF